MSFKSNRILAMLPKWQCHIIDLADNPPTHVKKKNPYPGPLEPVPVDVGTGLWQVGYGLVTVYPGVTCDNHYIA